jgi:competence protein ComEC
MCGCLLRIIEGSSPPRCYVCLAVATVPASSNIADIHHHHSTTMIERGWRFYPALKVLLPYAGGIALARLLAPSLELVAAAFALSLLILAIGLRSGRPEWHSWLLLVILLSGALSGVMQLTSPLAGLEGLSLSRVELIGRVVSTPIILNDRIEFTVDPDSLLVRNSVARPGGSLLVRIYDSTIAPRQIPTRGDHISLIGSLAIPGPAANPGGFDYGAYLRSRGIAMTMSVSRGRSMEIFRHEEIAWWESLIEWMRQRARDFAERYVGGEEGDIARALLIGEQRHIDRPTRDAFMRTGTIHVLAVSGLHVGVIALALFVLVSWIPNRAVQLPLYVGALALYAAVAGGSPSILRAVVMAAAFMLAGTLSRIHRPLNTLAVAGLLLLLVDPGILFDIGFQLSFASVAGIIMIAVPAGSIIGDRWPVLRTRRLVFAVLQLLLISLAAQLFTLPCVLYHFGSVSIIAPVVNIVVVPLGSIALGSAIAGVVCSGIPLLAEWFGGTAYLVLQVMVRIVQGASTLVMPAVEMGTIGLCTALVLAVMIVYMALSRTPSQWVLRSVAWSLSLILLLMLSRMFDPLHPKEARDLYLLRARHGTVLGSVERDTLLLYACSRDAADSGTARFIGEPLSRRLGLSGCRIIPLDSAQRTAIDRLLLINANGKEYIMRSLPVIIADTRQRATGHVHIGGRRLLYVPLRMQLDEAIVLRYDGAWKEVAWR